MLIPHPLLGPRDAAEFVYLGDAKLLERPNWQAETAEQDFFAYLYARENKAGETRELWYHEAGDRSWLVVTRNTVTHEILDAVLASEAALALREGGGA